MHRRSLLDLTAMAVLGLAMVPGNVVGQHKSLKEQLIGAWTLVSIDYVRQDGSRFQTFGAHPKGVAMFDGRGHYIITIIRSDHPNFAVNDRMQATMEEDQTTAQGTLTYFGTYTVSEAERTLLVHIESSSFPNWNGTEQKRLFTLTGDDLKWTNPTASTGGGTTEVVWKRAK